MIERSVHQRIAPEERGIALYRERGEQIERLGGCRYLMPGCSRDFYVVDLKEEICTCISPKELMPW